MAFQMGTDLAYLGHDAQATATGTTGTVSGTVRDSHGYDALAFFCEIGASATNNGLKAVGSTASGGTFTDLAGTWATGHTTALLLEIKRPAFRWVKPQLILGTSAHHGGIMAFGINPAKRPASGNATTLTYKFVNSPVSGTATSS